MRQKNQGLLKRLSPEKRKEIDGFQGWLYEQELSANTIDNYIYSVAKYYSLFDEVTKSNMIQYKRYMLEGRAHKTAAVRCVGMNRYCEYIGKRDCQVKNVKLIKRTRVENVPTMEEYRQILYYTEKNEMWKQHFTVMFLAKTGARANEFVRFEKAHLEKGEAEMWTKGKVRRIIIPRDLVEESRWYFDTVDNKYCFPNRYGDVMTARGVSDMLSKLDIPGVRKEVLHAHAFRHFFAIQFLERNKNIALLADLMGHNSIATTQIYLTLSASEQRDQLNDAMRGW